MKERVVITGLGVISSLGCDLDEFWGNLVYGKTGISQIESFDISALERSYAGEIKILILPGFTLTIALLPARIN